MCQAESPGLAPVLDPVFEKRSVCFTVSKSFLLPLFGERGLLSDSSCDWQGCFEICCLLTGLASVPLSRRMNPHSPPASFCTCFLSLVGTSLQTGGGEREEVVRSCVCEQVKLALQRELEGEVRLAERGTMRDRQQRSRRHIEREAGRQTVSGFA